MYKDASQKNDLLVLAMQNVDSQKVLKQKLKVQEDINDMNKTNVAKTKDELLSAERASLKADAALKESQKAVETANLLRDKARASLRMETANYEAKHAECEELKERVDLLETNLGEHDDKLHEVQASLQQTKPISLRQVIFSALVAVARTSMSEFHSCCVAFRHRILFHIILQSFP